MLPVFAISIILNLVLLGIGLLETYSPYSLRGEYTELVLGTVTVFLSLYSLFRLCCDRSFSVRRKTIISLLHSPTLFIICVFCFILLTGHLGAFLFGALYSPANSCITEYSSPSGKQTIVLKELCFGFACSHTAYLNRWIFEKYLQEADVGDAEACVFTNNSQIQWNKGENQLEWKTNTRHGIKKGVIKLF